MASKAQAGRTTKVSIGGIVGASDETQFTPIGELVTAPVKAPKWGTEDVTSMDSDFDAEFISTIRSDGSATFTLNRVSSDAGQIKVSDAAGDGELRAFKVELPKRKDQSAGDVYTFDALVLSTGDIDLQVTKKIGISIDVKLSGPLTLVVGAATA